MVLTKKERKEILNQRFSYEEVISKMGLTNVKQKDKFLKMSGWLGHESQSVAETFESKSPAPLWANLLLNEEVFPNKFLLELSIHFCREHIQRLNQEALYIDPRYLELVEVKEQWLRNKTSLGILHAAIYESKELLFQSYRSKNKQMISAAQVVDYVMHTNARIGVLNLFSAIDEIYAKESQKRYDYIKTILLS